jgi:SAM-dependent methyltransferase
LTGRHWFEDIADHLGPAYLKYSFTKGTVQEVDFIVAELGLAAGQRVLDVGCGPGRHSLEMASRGIEVVGIDVSEKFIELARAADAETASSMRADARELSFDAEFDAAVSLCQGAFGLGGPGPFSGDPANLGPDSAVLASVRRALRPGGRVAVSAFSGYFAVRYLEDSDTFDAATGVNHERTELMDEDRVTAAADLWTTCSTPRELQMLFERNAFDVDAIFSVEPGKYAANPPTTESPEFLVMGRKG